MICPTSTSPDLVLRRPDDYDARAGSQNEGWDDMPPVAVESLHHTATAAEAASPLDDFLSGEYHQRYPFGFTISTPTPTSNAREHKLSPYECEKNNEEEGSCDESSLVSELTQMTYRAELMKQAIMIEFQKFRQQKKQQGEEPHPEIIKSMFQRNMSCPDIQKSITSFVNITSLKMKAEARQHHHLEETEEELDATSDPTIQRRVDELFVEFGVRPARPIPHVHEISEENAARPIPNAHEISEGNDVRSRPSNEHGAATDNHLVSVIQLKLQLAQKQAVFEELSNKYNSLLLERSAHQHDMVAEHSRLMRENELLRAQLHQAGISSAAPTAHQLESSLLNLADSQDRLTPPSPNKPSHPFNIHQVLQDRLTSARVVDTKKVDSTNQAYRNPSKHREFKSFGTISTVSDTSSAANESPPLLQPSLRNSLSSLSNMIQGWRNRPTVTTEESSDNGLLLHRSLTMRTMVSNKSSDTRSGRRSNRREWGSALMLQRPSPSQE